VRGDVASVDAAFQRMKIMLLAAAPNMRPETAHAAFMCLTYLGERR